MPVIGADLGRNAWLQPICFAVVCVLNTATDFVVFLLLLSVTGNIVISNVVSYSCGATLSYLLNHKITFQATGARRKHTKSVALFILLTVAMIVVSTLLTLGFAMFVSPVMAKLFSVLFVAFLSFFGMKFLYSRVGSCPAQMDSLILWPACSNFYRRYFCARVRDRLALPCDAGPNERSLRSNPFELYRHCQRGFSIGIVRNSTWRLCPVTSKHLRGRIHAPRDGQDSAHVARHFYPATFCQASFG